MKRSTWHCADKPFNNTEAESGYHRSTWTGTGIIPENSGELFPRKPRQQYLCQLIAEFERCTQQSEDILEVKKEIDDLKRGMEESNTLIEDIKFESKILADKITMLTKNLQEMKTNHFQLRDEVSKEFRKTYKRIGTIDKEVDLMKYRQKMASKKHSMEMESLRWEMTVSKAESPSPTINADYDNRFMIDADLEECTVV